MSDQPEARIKLQEAVENTRDLDPNLTDAHLIKYVAIVDWISPTGERFVSMVDGQANGDRLASWDVQGLLFNVLHDPEWIANGSADLDDD